MHQVVYQIYDFAPNCTRVNAQNSEISPFLIHLFIKVEPTYYTNYAQLKACRWMLYHLADKKEAISVRSEGLSEKRVPWIKIS